MFGRKEQGSISISHALEVDAYGSVIVEAAAKLLPVWRRSALIYGGDHETRYGKGNRMATKVAYHHG